MPAFALVTLRVGDVLEWHANIITKKRCLLGDNGSMPPRYGGGQGSIPWAGSVRMWRSWQRATLPRWRSPVRDRSSARGRGRRFESRPGANKGLRSWPLVAQRQNAPRQCPSRPIGRATGLRHRASGFESQGGYSRHATSWWLGAVCKTVGRRVRFPRGPRWRVNRSGNRASLLTSARLAAWASIAPLSARGWLTERGRCPAGNREPRRESCAGSIPAPSAMERLADW